VAHNNKTCLAIYFSQESLLIFPVLWPGLLMLNGGLSLSFPTAMVALVTGAEVISALFCRQVLR